MLLRLVLFPLAWTLALFLPLSAANGPVPEEKEPVEPARIRLALDEKQFDKALELAASALEFEPENPVLMELASEAARQTAGGEDLAIYYGRLALQELEADEAPPKDRIDALTSMILELDLVQGQAPDLLKKYEDFVRDLYGLARSSANKKLYVNAVDLYQTCSGTRFERQAQRELEKIYVDEDAASVLQESGIDVPVLPKTQRELDRIQALDEKHSSWEDCYEKKTANYHLRTNMGYEVFKNASASMEQMNRFYRKVFQPKGRLTKCEIRIYKTREEFDRIDGREAAPTVRGYFVPGLNYVATYDPTEEMGSMDSLWTTLFHEASHQFTHEVSDGVIPGWLNEGTAAYFEGAVLLPNGSITTNDIPENRLRHLKAVLDAGDPSLREVVSYHRPGSYGLNYYPMGWGLVYFMNNYEDENCERVYLKPYQNMLNSYRKKKEDKAYDRFVEYLIDKPGLPQIETFAQFEKRFAEWMYTLHDDYLKPERAENWVARARRQVEFKKYEAASESYRYALRNRPSLLAALIEQADVMYRLKNKDAALYNYRQVLRLTRPLDPSEPVPLLEGVNVEGLREQALDGLNRVDKTLSTSIRRAEGEFAASAKEAASVYMQGGFPLQALFVLQDAIKLLGPDRELVNLRADIQERTGKDVRLWRRLQVRSRMSLDWVSGGGWKRAGPNALLGMSLGSAPAGATYRQSMPQEYRFECVVSTPAKDIEELGITLGGGRYVFSAFPADSGLFFYENVGSTDDFPADALEEKVADLKPDQLKQMALAVEVTIQGIELFLNGKSVGKFSVPLHKLQGRVGLTVAGGAAQFREMLVRY